MNYEETLHYLFTKLPMFSRTGISAYKADLTNTLLLCKELGNPQLKFRSIHVAGTNGKGSVSHMLAAIFQQAGYKTGLYTSPHLRDFRERIKINGEMISEQFVIKFAERTKTITEQIQPSFFELTVGMAFEYFEREKVDVAIIETGLGGRLDSTNIITPLLSVITNIGYDHTNLLGNTLDKIAFEKAGIIKENIPVVIGEYNEITKPLFAEHAMQKHSQIVFAEDIYEIVDAVQEDNRLEVILNYNKNCTAKTFVCDLSGNYQKNNIRTVITAIDLLEKTDFKLTADDVSLGLSKVIPLTGLHGRWEMISKHPKVILDVAHNEDGIKKINEQISLSSYQDLHIVFGMVNDKDPDKIISLLPKNAKYYFTKAPIPRAMDETELLARSKEYDLDGKAYNEVNAALDSALKAAAKDDLILVIGSVYVVGEVRTENLNNLNLAKL